MLLSDRLKQLRLRFGYSQAFLAEELSISRMAYTQYESGHREPPLEILIHLAQMYQVSLDFLLGISDLSRLPQLFPQESYLFSRLDRLSERGREHVFQALQQELGHQLLSDLLIFHEPPAKDANP